MTSSAVHPAASRRAVARFAALIGAALLMSACADTGLGGFSASGERRAERYADDGRHQDAASEYMGLASAASGDERTRLSLLAVEQWLDAGDIERAQNAMSTLAEPAAAPLLTLWQTNRAAMALYRGKPDEALQLLEPLSREPLPLRDRLRVEALRADTWIQKGDPQRSVELMTQRELWLDGQRAIARNRNRLWQGLLHSSPQKLRESAAMAADTRTRGWLSLAALATSTGQQGIGWNNGLGRWLESNRDHPAISVIGNARDIRTEALDYPRQVALLLPLSGRYAPNGRAIQNGFLGAYFHTANALDDVQTIRIYDVEAEGGASAAYQAAVTDGAEFVVGPLLRSSVAELANDILVPVPVLTLNYLPDETLAPPGLYQFALSPEDEAASAAVRALGDGIRRGVALVPDNAWGRRLLQSFATELEGRGGILLDYRTYSVGKQDFSAEIEGLMGLSGSVQRYRRLRANIGSFALQFDPRRRQDAEFIFLAGDAGHGRLLKSQLKFHYSGDLPVYSTSTVNVRDGRSNADLNGIMFADVPWVIDPQHWIGEIPLAYEEFWPDERRRLHAMGFDAYNLIASLYGTRGQMLDKVDGVTGRLFMDQFGRVHRELAWAQFQGGEVVALPEQVALEGPILDISDESEVLDPSAADEAPWDPPPQ